MPILFADGGPEPLPDPAGLWGIAAILIGLTPVGVVAGLVIGIRRFLGLE
ncbi:MAG: hypothetical protein WD027_00745 [Gaiellales bacterium]